MIQLWFFLHFDKHPYWNIHLEVMIDYQNWIQQWLGTTVTIFSYVFQSSTVHYWGIVYWAHPGIVRWLINTTKFGLTSINVCSVHPKNTHVLYMISASLELYCIIIWSHMLVCVHTAYIVCVWKFSWQFDTTLFKCYTWTVICM